MGNRIKEILEHDAKMKGGGTDAEWRKLRAYFDDASRSVTEQALRDLGMGITDNVHPIELPIVRRVVRRLATVYKSPATRWLERARERLVEDHPQQELLRRVLRKMRANAVWRYADRRRTLFGQCLLRAYPSDHVGAVVLRVFDPYNVHRVPSSSDADDIAADEAFAIRVRGKDETAVYELWERARGRWSMRYVNAEGEPTSWQPFDRTRWLGAEPTSVAGEAVGVDGPAVDAPSGGQVELGNPYEVLPCRMFYAEAPNGQPWILPRQSRVSAQIAVNAKANDLVALIRNEAHTDRFIATKRRDEIPDITGPGTTQVLPEDAKVIESAKAPKIIESKDALNNLIKLVHMAEGLPSADMDGAKTILTGAALRVQEGELGELREEQLEMVAEDEAAVFAIVRAVHNVHAETWREQSFEPDVELAVIVGATDTPQEIAVEQAWAHKEIDREYLHPIEWIAMRDKVDEDEAVRRWRRTRELFTQHPTTKAAARAPAEVELDDDAEEDAVEIAQQDMPRGPGSPGGDRAMIDEPGRARAPSAQRRL